MPDDEVTAAATPPSGQMRPMVLLMAALVPAAAWGVWRLGAPDSGRRAWSRRTAP